MKKTSKKDLSSIKIDSFSDFKGLKRRQVFDGWDKAKGKPLLNPTLPTKELIKGLRYVHSDFDKYDLRSFKDNGQTRKKAAKILLQFYELNERPNVKEYVPQKKNKPLIAKLAQQDKRWKKFYIPSDSKSSTISYKTANGKKRAIEKTKVATYMHVYFDMPSLITNPEKEVNRVLKGIRNIKAMKLHAGSHLVGGAFEDKKQLLLTINEFMQAYQSTFPKWMTGIKVLQKFNKSKKRRKKRVRSK